MNEPLNLDEIRARAEAATPGPWDTWPVGPDAPLMTREVGPIDSHPVALIYERADRFADADTNFISCARDDVPALVSELEQTRAEVQRLRAEREHSYRRGFEAGREYESFGQGMERYGEEMEREDRKLINRLYRLARTERMRWGG